jgi:hypothetical protein
VASSKETPCVSTLDWPPPSRDPIQNALDEGSTATSEIAGSRTPTATDCSGRSGVGRGLAPHCISLLSLRLRPSYTRDTIG